MEFTQSKLIMNINFGKILKEIMGIRQLNQLQLSKMLGIRQSQVSNWINNKSLPGYYSIKILCEKLKVEPNDLFDKST